MRTPRPVAVYLRDHETAAQAGLRAFRRVAGSHRTRPWGSDLAHLAAQVREDLRTSSPSRRTACAAECPDPMTATRRPAYSDTSAGIR